MSGTTERAGETDTNIHWLKPPQVEAMRDAAHEGRHGLRDDAIVTVMYDTGLRRGELAAVDRDMVDLEDGELRIPASIQKDYPNDNTPSAAVFGLDPEGHLRTVRTLRAYLDARDDDHSALFPSRKARASGEYRITGKGINDVVKRLASRAEVEPFAYTGRGSAEDVTAHTLRHSVAWRMLRAEEGNTLYDVRNRLRHATILTTEREYDHFRRI